jgi:hypothetical protein
VHLPDANIIAVKYLVWVIEGLHFAMFAVFFYSIFNIVFLRLSPLSLIYFSVYNMMHAIFGDCPMISLQNLLNPVAGNEQFLNTFWQGFFGDLASLMRMLISVVMCITFYLAFRQLKALNLSFGYLDFCFPWKDLKINQNQIKK